LLALVRCLQVLLRLAGLRPGLAPGLWLGLRPTLGLPPGVRLRCGGSTGHGLARVRGGHVRLLPCWCLPLPRLPGGCLAWLSGERLTWRRRGQVTWLHDVA